MRTINFLNLVNDVYVYEATAANNFIELRLNLESYSANGVELRLFRLSSSDVRTAISLSAYYYYVRLRTGWTRIATTGNKVTIQPDHIGMDLYVPIPVMTATTDTTLQIDAVDGATTYTSQKVPFVFNTTATFELASGNLTTMPEEASSTIKFSHTVGIRVTEASNNITESVITVPASAPITVEMCNNGNDTSPTWENVTSKFQAGFIQPHIFTNRNKVNANWKVRVRYTVNKGSTARYLLTVNEAKLRFK